MSRFRDIYEYKSNDEIAPSSQIPGDDGKWGTLLNREAKRGRQSPRLQVPLDRPICAAVPGFAVVHACAARILSSRRLSSLLRTERWI